VTRSQPRTNLPPLPLEVLFCILLHWIAPQYLSVTQASPNSDTVIISYDCDSDSDVLLLPPPIDIEWRNWIPPSIQPSTLGLYNLIIHFTAREYFDLFNVRVPPFIDDAHHRPQLLGAAAFLRGI
jgi:hypothetical protein